MNKVYCVFDETFSDGESMGRILCRCFSSYESAYQYALDRAFRGYSYLLECNEPTDIIFRWMDYAWCARMCRIVGMDEHQCNRQKDISIERYLIND